LRSAHRRVTPALKCEEAGCEEAAAQDGQDGDAVSSPRFRSVLDQFAGYKPGKQAAGPDGRSFKLSSNESPSEPLPSVVKVITEAALTVNRYPDNGAAALTEAIAERFGVPPARVAVGCGSVGVAQQLLEAVGEPGAEVIYAWRSFEAYPNLVSLAAADDVRVPLREEAHDLAAMAAAITGRTRLIFVCNPNNPTGTVVSRPALEAFLDQVPPSCLVVLDEAYHEYVRDESVPDGIQLYRERPNVAVLRTFSKAYGLAGLRVGFLVGHEPVAAAVRKTLLPFAVNSLAQAAAVASLAAEAELLDRVETVVGERARAHGELRASGWSVPPSEANFLWLRLGADTMDFAAACERAGVAVRPFAGEGVRVSVGDRAANDAFLAVAAAYPRRNGTRNGGGR
jgi:histidinol-phosphate aminotransferase